MLKAVPLSGEHSFEIYLINKNGRQSTDWNSPSCVGDNFDLGTISIEHRLHHHKSTLASLGVSAFHYYTLSKRVARCRMISLQLAARAPPFPKIMKSVVG